MKSKHFREQPLSIYRDDDADQDIIVDARRDGFEDEVEIDYEPTEVELMVLLSGMVGGLPANLDASMDT